MNAKKWIAMLCAAALAVSLTACGAQTTETADAGTTLTGQVSAVDGSEVTLLLGTLEEDEAGAAPDGAPGQGSQTGTPPEKPESNSGSGTNGQPPAKPDDASGDANGTPINFGFYTGDEFFKVDFPAGPGRWEIWARVDNEGYIEGMISVGGNQGFPNFVYGRKVD